jgi:KaiC/GvpD/RAD55 family RecA-like ATPase
MNVIASTRSIGDIFQQIQTEVTAIKAKRVFIDSITSLKLSTEPSEARYIVSEFIKNLEYLDCTTLMTIEILKMRGVKHDDTLHPYEIQEKGIVVHPTETVMNDKVSLFDTVGAK